MQKEIKKRVQTYGIAAVFLAAMLGALCYNFGVNVIPLTVQPSQQFLKTFSSYEDLKKFLLTKSNTQIFPFYYGYGWRGIPPQAATPEAVTPESSTYSTTNVQVEGVDEADIVKTDGGHIYLIANNSVFILKAYPPDEAQVLSKITFNETSPAGIFISADSTKLAVLGSHLSSVYVTYIYVYDISNKTNPVLTRDFIMTGKYIGSRMSGEHVYAVISEPAYTVHYGVLPHYEITIPAIYTGGEFKGIEASRIYYSNTSDNYYAFTTVVALNIFSDEEPNTLTILMGGTSNMYVSLNNIYITFHEWSDRTAIYRIRMENKTLTCEAQGKVPGYELNQFSMDEYNNHFRIATTSTNGTNVYILNMNLSVVGRLEGLAPGERFHSARFIGKRCYLVTFKKVDPFFVIDLNDPANPKTLGELKISGYSDYLHPYDESHIIGVGKETVEAVEGNFAWYQGIKISLFNVTDVSNPTQIANYTIGDRGSDSPVLNDHKAFLFNKSRNLLVIPVLVAKINQSKYPGGVPSWACGDPIWQGVCVFNISLENGFMFNGNVTHMENNVNIRDERYWIQRALYIDDVLYTISGVKVKMNSLEDLEFINEVPLS